jgi:DNA-binding MarR family transcriptional regulator
MKAVAVATPTPDVGEIQHAVSTIVAWSMRHDIYQETRRRAKFDLPLGSAWLLSLLAKSEPMRLSEVALALGVDNSTLTPQVQRLERDGLIVRKIDPRDRRAALLQVTRLGRSALARLYKTRADMFDEILCAWPAGERAEAAALLGRLASDLEGWTPSRSI